MHNFLNKFLIGARVNGNEAGNSFMYGGFGNYTFYPESANNIINGGGGYNGVRYLGLVNQYVISKLSNGTIHMIH